MPHIYQSSDLAGRRRELLDEAREGVAEIRDKDGLALVLLTRGRYELLDELKRWFSRFLVLEAALELPLKQRREASLGDFAWLVQFDDDDQRAFRHELQAALLRAMAEESAEPVDSCVRDWRTSAKALSSEKARRVLTGKGAGDGGFEEVARPK